MSISNIFDCCKKTEILLGISGIVLGTYATNAFLKSPFVGREINTIEVIKLPPVPDNKIDKPPINKPIKTNETVDPIRYIEPIEPINEPVLDIPLSEPVTYLSYFMNSTVVAIEGGLAYITVGTGVTIAISALTFYALKVLLNRLFMRINIAGNYARNLGENSFIGRSINRVLGNRRLEGINDVQIPPNDIPRPINKNDIKKFRYKPADDFRNKRKKKIIEEGKDLPTVKPQPFFNIQGNKLGGTIYFFDEEDVSGRKIANLRNIANYVLPEIKSEKIIIENNVKIEEIDENENINDTLKKIEEDSNTLEQIVNNTQVYTSTELYQEFIKLFNRFNEEHGLEIEMKPINEIFNNYGFPFQANTINQFNIDVQLNPSGINNFSRLYATAYDDLQNFISYGNKIVEGDITFTGTQNNIILDYNSLKIKNFNFNKGFFKLNFEKYTYPYKILYYYKRFILPLLAVLKKEGISKYSIKIEALFNNAINPEHSRELIKDPKLLIVKIPSKKYKDKYPEEEVSIGRENIIVPVFEGRLSDVGVIDEKEEKEEIIFMKEKFKSGISIKKRADVRGFMESLLDVSLSENDIQVLKEKYNYNYNYNLSAIENLKRIYVYKKELDDLDELFYNMYLKLTSIQILLSVIKKIYLSYQNK